MAVFEAVAGAAGDGVSGAFWLRVVLEAGAGAAGAAGVWAAAGAGVLGGSLVEEAAEALAGAGFG